MSDEEPAPPHPLPNSLRKKNLTDDDRIKALSMLLMESTNGKKSEVDWSQPVCALRDFMGIKGKTPADGHVVTADYVSRKKKIRETTHQQLPRVFPRRR